MNADFATPGLLPFGFAVFSNGEVTSRSGCLGRGLRSVYKYLALAEGRRILSANRASLTASFAPHRDRLHFQCAIRNNSKNLPLEPSGPGRINRRNTGEGCG